MLCGVLKRIVLQSSPVSFKMHWLAVQCDILHCSVSAAAAFKRDAQKTSISLQTCTTGASHCSTDHGGDEEDEERRRARMTMILFMLNALGPVEAVENFLSMCVFG